LNDQRAFPQEELASGPLVSRSTQNLESQQVEPRRSSRSRAPPARFEAVPAHRSQLGEHTGEFDSSDDDKSQSSEESTNLALAEHVPRTSSNSMLGDETCLLSWAFLSGHFMEDTILDENVREALRSSSRNEWVQAIKNEWTSLINNSTWKVVDVPLESPPNILQTKWVLKLKTKADGSLDKYKARLVVKGYNQIAGVDFHSTYAPVAFMTTVRTVLAHITKENLEAEQLDISSAFLQAKVSDDIFIDIPEGFDYGCGAEGTRRLLKLTKSLYGIKQAPYEWNQCLHNWLIEQDFVQSAADKCLYRSMNLTLIIFVDDLLLSFKREHRREAKVFKDKLSQRFPTTDLGELKSYLGMNVIRNRAKRLLTISQPGYIQQLLARFRMEDSKATETPANQNQKLSRAITDGSNNSNPQYRALVGSLLYLALLTRPDIAHAVVDLAKHVDYSGNEHWVAGKRVLRYLKGTSQLGITYRGSTGENQDLIGYADASYADCPNSRRSTSGSCFLLAGGAISWFSRTQKCVTRSSFESELVCISDTMSELIWLRKLLQDLSWNLLEPTLVFEDNQAVIAQLIAPTITRRTKHIEVKHFFAREQIQNGILNVQYIPTKEQVADGLTKNLGRLAFKYFRSKILGLQSANQSNKL